MDKITNKTFPKKPLNKEETEPIEELSKPTLMSYADKSKADLKSKLDKKDFGKTNLLHRAHGMQKVSDRLKKEEVEPIDELSKDLLGRYGGKALDSGVAAKKAGDEKTYKKRVDGIANSWTKPVKYDLQKKGWLKKEDVTPFKRVKELAKDCHKKLKKEMIGKDGAGEGV